MSSRNIGPYESTDAVIRQLTQAGDTSAPKIKKKDQEVQTVANRSFPKLKSLVSSNKSVSATKLTKEEKIAGEFLKSADTKLSMVRDVAKSNANLFSADQIGDALFGDYKYLTARHDPAKLLKSGLISQDTKQRFDKLAADYNSLKTAFTESSTRGDLATAAGKLHDLATEWKTLAKDVAAEIASQSKR